MTLAALTVGILFCLHPQPSSYGLALHRAFAGIIVAGGIARAFLAFRTFAALLWMSAAVFIASQRGFQVLYVQQKMPITSIPVVIALCIMAGVTAFTAVQWWLLNFATRPLATRITEFMAADDDASVIL